MANTVEDLADLLAALRAEPRASIGRDTRLREDLRIDGDDWDEVVLAITDRWQTDLSGFNFYDYFSEEPQIHAFYIWIKNRWNGKHLKTLTVGHLAAVVDQGSWFEPRQTPA